MPVSAKFRKAAANKQRALHTPQKRAAAIVRRAMAQAPLMGQLRRLGPELKSLDVAQNTYGLNTTAAITCVNLIRVGSTFCNRIGRKIELKSLRVSGLIQPIRTIAADDYARILVVYDAQSNGATPAIADILQTTDQATTNTTTAFSGLNVNNRDRFKILRDLRVVLPSSTYTAGVITNPGMQDPVSRMTNFDVFINLKGLTTQYKADSAPAVIGDIATGALFVVSFGAYASASEGYNTRYETRLRYVDI